MTEDNAQPQRTVANRYVIVGELGRGGMGVVWLAEDRTIGRRVAIKELLLPAGIPQDERHVFEERVLREARTAGRLSDPGIVTVHDVLQEDGATFIVMELIEAPNLSDVVLRNGALPAEQLVKIADQLLSALQTAHAAGVVHRDVKPSNVMFAANGRVKLTDFGIAQSTEDTRLTSSGLLVGSPSYISPERLLGQDAVPASDLWSLGATLFFAAEGFGAYERQNTAATIQAVMNERPHVRKVQGPLADLIMGLLDSNPMTRVDAARARYLIDQARVRISTGPMSMPPVSPPMGMPVSHPAHQPISQPVGQLVTPGTPFQVVPIGPYTGATPPPPVKKSRRVLAIAAVSVFLVGTLVAVFAMTGVFRSESTADPQTGGQSSAPQTTSKTKSSVNTDYDKPKSMLGTKTYGPGGEVTVDDGRKGDCYNDDDEPVDSCDDPHDIEIFDQVDLTGDSTTWPGPDEVKAIGESGCVDSYASEVTIKDKDEVLRFLVLVPTQQGWNGGKRKALCVVARADGGKLKGSVAGN
ncbi:serine/threonine protein kinase [Kibdelosporangium banguiense]|uniref:non-specific serine/threonine protein kinase n=1 Tax=Kibdelosporangium banguiense TaxID=1365924 RepID=A0ABS4TIW2_9PSEU|nr:protein kinase [Kibdelosporangium banguiense]MBP2323964.1 serine/threonine protein kinase [Kibdelosporangium banguiense]